MERMSCLFGNSGQGAYVAVELGETLLRLGDNARAMRALKQPDQATEEDVGHDWYLREWMDHVGKRQADLIRDFGWERGRVSKLYNGKTPYSRAYVHQLAGWLGIAPHELLMLPKEAMQLRRLRAAAEDILKAD